MLTSDKVGAANTLSVVATDTDVLDGNDLTRLATASLTSVQTATDAIIYVDRQKVTKACNNLSDVISGVTIALKKADLLTTGSLSIALDKDASMSNLRIDENILGNYSPPIDSNSPAKAIWMAMRGL